MNKKIIGILIILIGFILIISIVYIIFFHDFTNIDFDAEQEISTEEMIKRSEEQPEKTLINKIKAITSYKPEESKKINKEDINEDNLKRMASSFVERFGSYSNHSSFNNIIDLKIFMNSKMQDWADDYIEELREKNSYSDIYYGITTKSISQEIKKYDDDVGKAEILVKTQRRESIGTMSNTSVFYEDILIIFIKERGVWKVDSIDWK